MKKLRLGLILDTTTIPAWAYEMLRTVLQKDIGTFVFIVKKAGPSEPKHTVSGKNHFVYNTFTKIENAFFKPSPNAFAEKDISALNIDLVVRDVQPEQTPNGDRYSRQDLDFILHTDTDVIIYLGQNILRGDILSLPKFGVWSYYHGDNLVNRGRANGFREVMNNTRDTGAILQILTEDIYNGKILQRSWSSTDRISVNRNRNKYYWNAASFIPRKLQELYDRGGNAFLDRVARENATPLFYSSGIHDYPGNMEAIRLIMRHAYKWFQSKLVKIFYYNQWILLYSFEEHNKSGAALSKYKFLKPSKDRFWADPFVVAKEGKYFIFLEEGYFKENNGRAHLSVLEMDAHGNYGAPTIILKKPYHLSYPNVFEHQGDFYMIPESMDDNTIQIYKCTKFPYDWEFVMNLMENVKAVDTTIVFQDGLYWMFVNIRQFTGASECDELFLFYAESLLTNQWTPHIQNPVISDVKSARPAGNFFRQNGQLFRPSQDCSYRYGHSTIINKVIELSKERYVEEKVSSIEPNWHKNIVGTHTFNSQGGLTVIDAILQNKKL